MQFWHKKRAWLQSDEALSSRRISMAQELPASMRSTTSLILLPRGAMFIGIPEPAALRE
ncbi:hypothetical protein AAZ33_18655 [Edwardsiella sp. LADL05-105]|uniref:Uncharacterized protein n=1 Tax=Edwardsiella anguillarum ET080813 TaxID=667120 RepID=A0A076LU53_9GAMM|nr:MULTISPECIES: hypothetical protein [Edwardsiella]AIJ09084.1 Hypothetical protein ETEE_2650 [Edwardsiella anguillarum ET080813]UBU94870.1 hypothetical protein AAZ33_18655 [Edwardsiella sp. LADL05-105]UOU79936.1 hypothetical protein MUN71_04825 [Edwardsiella anguillarum]WHP88467.1 hypothetical protein MQ088_04300 [Edwardsiella anguillarum]WHP92268.1 hypothetical protein MQ091_04300 [Edwardsiella anguillarum]